MLSLGLQPGEGLETSPTQVSSGLVSPRSVGSCGLELPVYSPEKVLELAGAEHSVL